MKEQGDCKRRHKIHTKSFQTGIENRDRPKNEEKTVGDVLKYWLNDNRLRLKGGTINKYQNLIDTQVAHSLGELKITAVSTEVLNSFVADTKRGVRIFLKAIRQNRKPLTAYWMPI